MEKVFVAKKVAAKLFATEAAVDGALVEAAELMSVMLAARKDVNTSLVFADDCQVKLMEAMKALSEARTAMVGVHNELNDAKLRLGIRTTMNGAILRGHGQQASPRGERTVVRGGVAIRVPARLRCVLHDARRFRLPLPRGRRRRTSRRVSRTAASGIPAAPRQPR